MKQPNLLIVEDDRTTQILIKGVLENDYRLTIAETGVEALAAIQNGKFDLILLDLVLPDTDGYQLCIKMRQLDETQRTPIIMLTSKGRDTDKIMGFSLGADDYILKPFNPFELKARVHAKLKWVSQSSDKSDVILSGSLEMHVPSQRLFHVQGQSKTEIELTSLEFKLIRYFISHPDHVLSRQQILDAVWGHNAYVNERTVDTHISKLRKKMKKYVNCLHAVHGSGYRYTTDPQLASAS